MHHSAGAQVITGGTTLNHIGGNGERRTRKTEARLHVREEIPFYTGRRVNAADVAEVLA